MLWVGFNDFQNKIIVCEWTTNTNKTATREFDERVYNQIFQGKWYTFISAWWSIGDMKNHIHVAKKIFEWCIYSAVKDSDSKNATDLESEKTKYKSEFGFPLFHIAKHDLEEYILDNNVVSVLLSKYWNNTSEDFTKSYNEEVNKLKDKNYWVNIKSKWLERHDIHDNIYQLIHKEIHSLSNKKISLKYKDIQDLLAQIIYDHKSDGWPIQALYEELETCIFWTN